VDILEELLAFGRNYRIRELELSSSLNGIPFSLDEDIMFA
jgi:hypothetical protein